MKKTMTLVLLFAFVLCCASVYAANFTITVNQPTTNEYVKGSFNFKATTNVPGNGTECAFQLKNSSASTYTNISNVTSTNVSFYSLNNTYKILIDGDALFDGNTYQARLECHNNESSDGRALSSAVTFKVDNTVPVCSLTSSQASNGEGTEGDAWSWNAYNGTSCTIYFDDAWYTGTVAGGLGSTTCSWSQDSAPPSRLYGNVIPKVSDGLNETECTAITSFDVSGTGGGGSTAYAKKVAQQQAISVFTPESATEPGNLIMYLLGAVGGGLIGFIVLNFGGFSKAVRRKRLFGYVVIGAAIGATVAFVYVFSMTL